MKDKIGTVFNYNQLPDVSRFPFIISLKKKRGLVRKGQFVCTESEEGFLMGMVEKILILNEYFSDALTIKAYNDNNNPNILKGLFPSEDFEFSIAIVKNLGIILLGDIDDSKIEKINRMTYPARPGAEVYLVSDEILSSFLGFDLQNGLRIGSLKVSNTEVKLNLDRLLGKHLGILAISGAGKSYLTSVLVEELLSSNSGGSPAIFLIDVHGEYTYLKEIPELKDKIIVQDASFFQIAVPIMNAQSFRKVQNEISTVQLRELSKHIKKLKKTKKNYSIPDIIQYLEEEQEGNKSSRQALIGWLEELHYLRLFGPSENPLLKNIIKPQKLIIFNLQSEINIRKKQIMVDYICSRMFYMRRMNEIPPFLLIIEEAHQFSPEAAHSKAISKSIIETIAREGRKFMACLCLISQRPKKLSTTALSQLNSKMILNIKNPYDLKHLMESSEAITKDYADMISSLGVGEMLLMGNAINYPVFINIRQRSYPPKNKDINLSQACLNWQEKELF
ncbi:MAG: ATP-binding protein [Candidatus Lokiarchaeota archaeon]|nr:ATP-binding protein [Candidatus Lokiarchaeota archaeon]